MSNIQMTIIDLDQNECCGCESCASACRFTAIQMKQNHEGFFYPQIDEAKCVKCGKCARVCPVLNHGKQKTKQLVSVAGYSKDEQLVLESSSGGFFGVIARNFLKNGKIAGVSWSSDFKYTKHIIIDNLEDLQKIQKSKYIQSRKDSIYDEVQKCLINDENILFTGCPCEVAALKLAISEKYQKNLYCIDLICQGPTSPKAMDYYVDEIEEKFHGHIISINMRLPIGSWIPQYLRIAFENNKTYLNRLYDTAIGDSIRVMQRTSCYTCKFAGDNRYSDLTLGDYHEAVPGSSYYHESGVSIAIAHTEKGLRLIDILKMNDLYWEPVSYEEMLKKNPRLGGPWSPFPERAIFSENFAKYGLVTASNSILSVKRVILRKLPVNVRIKLEKIKNHMKKD